MSTQNNKGNDIGNKIQQSVADALMSGDFSKLNVEITSSVREVLNEVGDQINSAVNEAKMGSVPGGRYNGANPSAANPQSRGFTNTTNRPYRDTADAEILKHQQRREELRQRQQQQRELAAKKARQPRVRFVEVGGFSGPMNIIFGPILIMFCSLMLIGMYADGDVNIAASIFGYLGALFGAFAVFKGTAKMKLLKIAKQYKDLAKEKMYVTVDTISEATGTSQKTVIKNIKKMLSKGFFPEGYLDESNTTFMVSKEIYQQYLETKKNQIIVEENNAEAEATPESELNSVISEGMRYIDRLRELNEKIPGVVITQKLSKLEQLLNEIFNSLREHPEEMPNCRKLMEYYLPTMIKLVEAYAEYDKVSQPGEDIVAAKKEIENTLDIINQAFVELLNKLYQNSVWDVKAEAQVLKTMLHQAGLTEGSASAVLDEEEDLLQTGETGLEENVVSNV